MRETKLIFIFMILLFSTAAADSGTLTDNLTIVEKEQLKIKYNLLEYEQNDSYHLLAEATDDNSNTDFSSSTKIQGHKSPGKAFIMSLIVPGLGQYYNGSRIKPFVYAGIEAASWMYHAKWHKDGEDITEEFEAFNRAHWSEEDYTYFLTTAYGASDDEDSLFVMYPEINHHLPDTYTQQYYEMTGKYSQFAWGWDDAVLNDSSLYDFVGGPPQMTGGSNVPYSANRVYYENRRNDANNQYDKATRMLFAVLLNHVVSAFEAMFQSKRINNQLEDNMPVEDNSVKFDLSFKTKYQIYDTPQLKLSYWF